MIWFCYGLPIPIGFFVMNFRCKNIMRYLKRQKFVYNSTIIATNDRHVTNTNG